MHAVFYTPTEEQHRSEADGKKSVQNENSCNCTMMSKGEQEEETR